MTWDTRLSRFYRKHAEGASPREMRANEGCFVRKKHKCGRMPGASKSCFIACPADDDMETTLALISEKLNKVGIDPIIAVKDRAYGQDIFCTKVCGKIIESQFCIVLLDEPSTPGKNIPNPNVYYEYGFMTALGKHIIPLQKEDLKLAFNIQGHEAIKYNPANLSGELDRAIKDAIKITEQCEEKPALNISEKGILRNFELRDIELKDDEWFLYKSIDDTDFKGFGQHKKVFYAYVGKIDEEKEMASYLEDLNVVLHRTSKEMQKRIDSLKEEEEELSKFEEEKAKNPFKVEINPFMEDRLKTAIKELKSKIELMKKFYIAFIVNPRLPSANITKFSEKAKELVSKYENFELVLSEDNLLKLEDISIPLTSFEIASE